MWCEIKEWLESGGILPSVEDLRDDLIAPEYGFASNGKIQLESKDDIKKRGLASPDLADALALTFAAPVMPKSHRAAMQKTEPYDPLNRHRRKRR
jgi:phage terminase large subunit